MDYPLFFYVLKYGVGFMETNEDRKYCVYVHTSPSGKKYVGITSTKPIDRWGSDGRGYLGKTKSGEFKQPAMANAILKYSNWDEWNHEIVATNLSVSDAKNMEQELITQYRCTNSSYGYNISPGGECPQPSDETKHKISESHKGLCASDEAKLNMSNAHKKRWDKNLREEVSKKYTGKGNPMYGVHRYGELNPMFGKTHSDDAKQKISESNCGINNPNSKRVVCIETGVVYDSGGEAERMTGIKSQTILACCNHKPSRKTAGGFHWEFYEAHINKKEGLLCVL